MLRLRFGGCFGALGGVRRAETCLECAICVSLRSLALKGLGGGSGGAASGAREAQLVSAAFMCKAGSRGSALAPSWNRSRRRAQTSQGRRTLQARLFVPNAAGASALN